MLLVASAIPSAASASIVINEFLYDAPGTDTDQEFVELYNNGASAIDLTKWKINDGSNHTLNAPPKNGGTGSISIAPGGYVLLVDNAANFIAAHSGVSGTVIDTVLSLPNTGGTISLLDDSGATADSVSYTKDQGGNGDGNSLQRGGGAWIAAAPTMDAANASSAAAPATADSGSSSAASTTAATDTSQSSSSSSQTPAAVSSYVPPPVPEIFADGGSDRTVIVGADTEFNGRAYNRQKVVIDHVRFLWNFGDGTSADGPSVLHHYRYPGRYAVVLTIAQDKDSVSDRFVVTAEAAKLAFFANPDGSVTIQNNAGRDIDLSGWLVRSFGRTFALPDDSIVLTGASMRIAHETLNFFAGLETELAYPNGVVALTPGVAATPAPEPPPAPKIPVEKPAPLSMRVSAEEAVKDSIQAADLPLATSSEATTAALAAAAGNAAGSYWWLGALGLALIAGGGVIAVKRAKAREWDIIEQSE